jgi:hypothetical protein
VEPTRRRNWLALAVGIIVQSVSYILYAAAFARSEGESGPAFDPGLVAIALVIAPLVFLSVGLISRRSGTPRALLRSMGSLVVLGLALGLLSPIVGAAAGFGVGIAISLNMPEFEGQLRRRLVAVALAVAYMVVMLVLIPPAGVLAGAVLPGLMVGFADEYGAWREARTPTG